MEAGTAVVDDGQRVALSAIIVGERHRREMGDLRSLADSIAAHGLLHPVVVTPTLHLIAGQRRLEAVKLLEWSEVPVTVLDVDDLLLAERDENAERKDFAPSEAVAIGRMIEERHRAKIAEVRPAQCRKGSMVRDGIPVSNGEGDPVGGVDAVASHGVGMGQSTYYRAKKIVAAAEADPATFGDLAEQMDATGNVNAAFVELAHRKAKAGTVTGAVPKAAGRHAVHRNTRHMDADKIMENGARSLEGIALAFDMLDVAALDGGRRAEWVTSLARSIKSLQRVQKELRHE